jgi:predicted PurR-regulated permease PerM
MEARTLRFPLWAKIVTVGLVAAVFLVLLRAMGGLLSPFLWALVTAYLFNPLVRLLTQRSRISRFWWVLLLYIIVGVLVYVGVGYLWPRLYAQFTDLQAALPDIARRLSGWLERNARFSIGTSVIDLRPAEADILEWFTGFASEITASVPELLLGVIERLILLLVYLVVTFYLLMQSDQLVESVYGLIPAPYRAEIRELGRSIDRVLGAYIRSQLMLIALMSVLTYIPLSLLGVKYALVLAIATGFLEVIPFVGPWTAAGSAMLVSLVQTTTPWGWPNWLLAAVVGVIYTVLRQGEDHLIIPNLVGYIVKLHPIIVIFAILAGGHLGGALGLLLAVPLAATVRIILSYLYAKLVDSPTPVAEIRANEQKLLDRPTSSPLAAPPGRGDLTDGTSPS